MAKQHAEFTFELYILEDKLDIAHWQKFYKAIMNYLGTLSSFRIYWQCPDNIVRYFIRSNKDLSSLSNAIDGFILRPAPASEAEPPDATGTEHFVQFMASGNLLDLKERYTVKKGKDLKYAWFDVRVLTYENAAVSSALFFEAPGGVWLKASKLMTAVPAQLLAIDFASNTHYLKKSVPKYLNIEKSMHILSSDNVNALFEVDAFPYFSKPYYLNLTSYEFYKHSFIVGASGSGKSKLISLFVDRLHATSLAQQYRVIIIDPHAALADDFAYLQDKKVINFGDESTELFGGTATDISAATELTGTLFKSLMGDNANSKADRLLRFSLYVLLTAQAMSLGNLKRFLIETDTRNQLLEHVQGYIPDNISHFFGADFNDMRTKYYNETISPIVSLVDEMQLQPALVSEGELSLSKTIQENFLTVFSLNKVSMGDKVVKTVAGLLIQQIFLLAQARAFGLQVILIIDEVSVVQNPALAAILAEARKFNLTVILTQQYFGQIEKDLRDAIFANTYNYYVFKVSEEDARALEGNLTIELPKELVEKENAKGIKEQDTRVKLMTSLHPRECLVRVLANGQVVPAVKARTLDAPHFDRQAAGPDKLKAYKQQSSLPEKFDFAAAAASASDRPELDAKPATDFAAQPTAELSEIVTPEASSGFAPEPQSFEPEPETFTEPSTPKDTEAISHAAAIAAIAGYQPKPHSSTLPNLGPQTFNLSDLLAEHSSSRDKINRKA